MSNMLRTIQRRAYRERYGKLFGNAWRHDRREQREQAERERRAEMRRIAIALREKAQ